MTDLTAAEQAILLYLGDDREATYSGGSLVSLYEERRHKALAREGYPNHPGSTTDRRHAWRRTGGRMLASLAAKGMLSHASWDWGVPSYRLTAAGQARVRELQEASDG